MAYPQVVVLLALLSAGGQPPAAPSDFSELEVVGKTLYAKDRAAWLATDRLVESNGGLPEALRGWVTLPSGEGWRVVFVEEKDGGYCTMMSVEVEGDSASPLQRSGRCEPLTSEQRAMFLARQTALSALRTRCTEAYNSVVLPQEGTEATWAVYLLAATQQAGKVVVGGHARVLVRDGDVVDYQPLSKGCLTLDVPSPEAGKPIALMLTHVLDDHPIETDVFLSLLHATKLYVMTESALWSVDQGRIELLMDGDEFKAYKERAEGAADPKKGGGNH